MYTERSLDNEKFKPLFHLKSTETKNHHSLSAMVICYETLDFIRNYFAFAAYSSFRLIICFLYQAKIPI